VLTSTDVWKSSAHPTVLLAQGSELNWHHC
jgi:hypothetical protein